MTRNLMSMFVAVCMIHDQVDEEYRMIKLKFTALAALLLAKSSTCKIVAVGFEIVAVGFDCRHGAVEVAQLLRWPALRVLPVIKLGPFEIPVIILAVLRAEYMIESLTIEFRKINAISNAMTIEPLRISPYRWCQP
jgi:hypothetical protein